MTTPKTAAAHTSETPKPPAGSRTWVKPRLVSYGPISKLTQGSSGTKADGLTSTKPCL